MSQNTGAHELIRKKSSSSANGLLPEPEPLEHDLQRHSLHQQRRVPGEWAQFSGLSVQDSGWSVPERSPPMVVKLESTQVLQGEAASCLGRYLLEKDMVKGRPTWRHHQRHSCRLVFTRAGWEAGTGGAVEVERSLLRLRDPKAASPTDASERLWEVFTNLCSWRPTTAVRCSVIARDTIPTEFRPTYLNGSAGSVRVHQATCASQRPRPNPQSLVSSAPTSAARVEAEGLRDAPFDQCKLLQPGDYGVNLGVYSLMSLL
mmetsp:Transcript_70711/g.117462  ORF Transcript_70711/g.117462 Transcript_70711/m.117462 type:complete len:260 (+) Transcript_70711:45-824(+)|eukprot:CAMPEP_0119306116 /NCGR_PEP_ID=MMETSP1333-20130426/6942_1 /TAXON_ID=418940 /ORGANISM="Scyphosphaera apsteinii, Strain RCC1455" /LENGTH=259 /DNA_ID=CAMNT_0007309343 /DNA_START=38 /DNA_END=817 /DNA_ORIENTATION=-